jgi:two-component system cell cycle sensor histidine kinase/response regulator CckA
MLGLRCIFNKTIKNIYIFKRVLSILFKRVVWTILVLCLLQLTVFASDQPKSKIFPPNILILNSYHSGFFWSEEILRGIRETLRKRIGKCKLYVEFMDTKRFYDGPVGLHSRNLARVYNDKYKNISLDLIITTDDNAFQFVLTNQNLLFNNTPVVFCGVNRFNFDEIRDKPFITGVVEKVDHRANIELVLKLHPQTKKLVYINDNTTSSKRNRESINAIMGEYSERLTFQFLWGEAGLTLEELLEKVKLLKDDAVVIFQDFFLDRNGVFRDPEEVMPLLSAVCPVPIYVHGDIYIGYGCLGGKVVSGYHQGKYAAELALKILKSNDFSNLPVELDSPNVYMFDKQELDRFGIPESKLPEGSMVVNRPFSVYDNYKLYIWSALIAIAVMAATITFLAFNISQRRRIERDLRIKEKILRESETKLRSGFEHASIGKTINSVDGKFIDANEAYCKITGYKRNELLAINWKELVHPNYLEVTSEQIESMVNGKSNSFVHEVKAIRKNGDNYWAKVNVVLVRGKNGEPLFLFADVEDITHRKEMERQNKLFEDIINRSQDFIGVADPDRNAIYVNPAGQKMVGLDGDSAVRKSKIEDYFFPEDLPFVNETIMPALMQKGRWSGEFRFRHFKTGKPLHVLYDLFRSKDMKTGQIFNYATISRNIADLKRAEQERGMLYKALENSINGFDIINEEGEFIYANKAYARMWGYDDPLEIIGTSPASHCDDPTIPEQIIKRLKQEGKYEVEFIAKRKDGSTFDVFMSAELMHNEIGNELYVGTSIDISERKKALKENEKLQAQLIQAQKLESLGRLAGGVAHDLNNMLSPILGYCEMLMADVGLNENHHNKLQSILKAGLSARTLVGQLLAFSRKQKLKFEIVDVDDILFGFEKLLRRTIRENIDLKIINSPEIKTVMADIGQLEQIIMNLCVNASDAMPNGGKLIIETCLTDLDENYDSKHKDVIPGDYVLMSITDTGHGMDKTTSKNVFEPFFTTKGDHGTGLGLATVYGIVKQHNGNIWVYSEIDKGTVFKVYLPFVKGGTKNFKASLKSDIDVMGSETILLAEDQEEVRKLAADILKSNGYTVITAVNGKEALDIWTSGKYSIDLLITDVIMPEMNGKELYDTINSINPGIKVLYMSGYMDNILPPHEFTEKGSHYISKPFNVKEFLLKVRQAIEKKDQKSP